MGKKSNGTKKSASAAKTDNGETKAKRVRNVLSPLAKLRKRLASAEKAQTSAVALASRWGDDETVLIMLDAAKEGQFREAVKYAAQLEEAGFAPPATSGRAKYVAKVGDHVWLTKAGAKWAARFRLSAESLASLYVSALDPGGDPAWCRVSVGSADTKQAIDHVGPCKVAHLTAKAPEGVTLLTDSFTVVVAGTGAYDAEDAAE